MAIMQKNSVHQNLIEQSVGMVENIKVEVDSMNTSMGSYKTMRKHF